MAEGARQTFADIALNIEKGGWGEEAQALEFDYHILDGPPGLLEVPSPASDHIPLHRQVSGMTPKRFGDCGLQMKPRESPGSMGYGK